MKNFNAIHINEKVSTFLNTFVITLAAVFTVHLLCLSIYSFAVYDWSLVVSGFDFSQWSVIGRCLILVPYLAIPTTIATLKATGFNLTKLRSTNDE